MGRLWRHGHRNSPTFQIWLDLAAREGGKAEEHLKAVLVTLGVRYLPCLTHWGLWLLGHSREKPEYGQVRSYHSWCGKGYGGSIWAGRQAKADGRAGFLSFLAVTKPWGQVRVGSK